MVATSHTNDSFAQPLTPNDLAILGQVDGALSSARLLKEWWRQKNEIGGYANQFELTRTFNPPSNSFGFFDQACIGERNYSIMGSMEDMLFDTPKKASSSHLCDEFREFVLRYFLRVSDYRPPEAYVDTASPTVPAFLAPLSWCTQTSNAREGFGYSQHFYKLRDSDTIGRFSEDQRFSIIDLREVMSKYEWIVLKVRIFDFNLKFAPFGPDLLQLVFPLKEESYLVLSPDFVVADESPSVTELGRYGFGYAFLKSPENSPVAYGPGRFELAFKLITFRILRSGEIRVHMVFVANRPNKILNISLNPIGWSQQLADTLSLGMFSRVLGQSTGPSVPIPPGFADGFDPLTAFVSVANLFSGGWAARDLCISREQLEKEMLIQHFNQHYQLIVGSLLTWRQIPNWLDTSSLPDWVTSGRAA
jgi:hypothetical protein